MELCPLDSRYRSKTEQLRPYFSNFAYTKYRVFLEFLYFYSILQFIHKDKDLPYCFDETLDQLNSNSYCIDWYITLDDYNKILEIEKTTNHDVKAIEYFVKNTLIRNNPLIKDYTEFVHFGLTSQDINNVALSMMIKDALTIIIIPEILELKNIILNCGIEWKNIVMLSKTHGQPAVPTTLGKEFLVFSERLQNEYVNIVHTVSSLSTKMGGAVGNLNAHYAAYPNMDWDLFFTKFIEHLTLKRQTYTTQIEHYDELSCIFDICRRINNIYKDFCQDIWLYISMDYISQKVIATETGSSTMPHKVNPIHFENAEGNIAIANALLNLFSNKLPVSRLQRDLTDSTVVRNIGMSFGYMLVAIKSIKHGLANIYPNNSKLNDDLQKHHYVIVEGLQTILRKHHIENPYEIMKELTRGKLPTKYDIIEFINNLHVSDDIKNELLSLSILNYTGNSINIPKSANNNTNNNNNNNSN